LLISTKATALRRNQRPRASFLLAGFEVTLIGRFWVTPEVMYEVSTAELRGEQPIKLDKLIIDVVDGFGGPHRIGVAEGWELWFL
jgi:hypothetical protein